MNTANSQMVVITRDATEINKLTEKGWKITSVTAQHVAAGEAIVRGEFCFVLNLPHFLKDKV